MRDDSDDRRELIHRTLQEAGPINSEDKAAVLTGWAVVAEWMDEDGERWLTKSHAATVPCWTASGYHHEALYGDWPTTDPDDG
jgi:hypothetical protein